LPKVRVPAHATTLRDDSYAAYVSINEQIHGAGDDCGVCGHPPTSTRRLDRDHDHRSGFPRGLAHVRCNHELLRNATLEEARLVVAYLERVELYYASVRDAAAGGSGE